MKKTSSRTSGKSRKSRAGSGKSRSPRKRRLRRERRQSRGRAIRVALIAAALIGLLVLAFGITQSTNKIHRPLSPSVKSYEESINRLSAKYDIEEYTELVSAVMMQESHGRGNDPMQSSEGNYNTRFPKEPHGITDPSYSIDCGVHQLADALKLAECRGPKDIKRISLAIQGYNYGDGYIHWALEKDGKYTRKNAAEFSEKMKSRLGTEGYGDPDYVDHVMRYYPYW